MKKARVLTNVGWFRDLNSNVFLKAYLAVTEADEYFLTFVRPAVNIAGTDFAKSWAILSYGWLQGGNTENNISNVVKGKLYPGDISFGDGAIVEGSFVNFTTGVILNGDDLFGAAGSSATAAGDVTTLKAVLSYSELGAGISEESIEALLGVDVLPTPIQQSATGVVVSNAMGLLPPLNEDPAGAIKGFFGSKIIEYSKANPISAGIMGVGAIQLGNALGLWSFNPLGVVGVKSKTTKKKAALGF